MVLQEMSNGWIKTRILKLSHYRTGTVPKSCVCLYVLFVTFTTNT